MKTKNSRRLQKTQRKTTRIKTQHDKFIHVTSTRQRRGSKTQKGDGADKVPKHQTGGLYEKDKDIQSQRNRRWDTTRN